MDTEKEKNPGSDLDPGSETFDCMKALYDPSLEIFNQDAVCFDSVEQCIKYISNPNPDTGKENSKPALRKEEPEKLERRFLPEQMPVQSNKKDFRHVLSRMEEFKDWPLGTLRSRHLILNIVV